MKVEPRFLRSRACVGLLVAVALAATSCGGRLSDQEVLERSGVEGGRAGAQTVDDTADVPSGVPTTMTPSGGSTPTHGAIDDLGAVPADPTAPEAGASPPTSTAAAIGTPGERGPVVIASVGNYSGPGGAGQAGIPRGVQAWAADTNSRGGLFGRQVQVIVADDGGDPARYNSIVQDFVENRHVIAFVGNGTALTFNGGVEYLERKGVPVFGTECSGDRQFKSPVTFPQCTQLRNQVLLTVRAALQLTAGKTKVGVLTCSEADVCHQQQQILTAAAVQSLGGKLVYQGNFSLAGVDFTAQCQGARDAGVELLYLAADPTAAARVGRSCDRQGYRPVFNSPSLGLSGDSASQPGLKNVVNLSTVFPFVGVSGAAYDEFRRVTREHLGREPGLAEAVGWAAAKLFELGATRAAQSNRSLTSKTLLAAGHTIKGETLSGLTVTLDFSGPSAAPTPCGFVLQGDGNGRWTAPLGAKPLCLDGGAP